MMTEGRSSLDGALPSPRNPRELHDDPKWRASCREENLRELHPVLPDGGLGDLCTYAFRVSNMGRWRPPT